MKYLIFGIMFLISACSPMVKNSDIEKKLTSLGYNKILIQSQRIDCGRFGTGKHFIATRANGSVVLGQVCYLKGNRDVQYNIAINREMSNSMASPLNGR